MAAGLGDGLHADEQTWPFDKATGHSGLQAPIGTRCIAHGGEAAAKHGSHELCRFGGGQGRRLKRQSRQVVRSSRHVHVRVDQARQHHAASGVNLTRRIVHDDRLLRHAGETLAFDDDGAAWPQLTGDAVKQPGVANDLAHGLE